MTPRAPLAKPAATWTLPNRLAYVVSHSFPYSSNGYAVRSHQVAKALKQAGVDVIVFNRPGRPWSIEGFGGARTVTLDQTIEGVRYIFLPMSELPAETPEQQMQRSAALLAEAFEVFRPAMVLAASNWETAEPARRAAAQRGNAFFYEMRGFWEMSRALRDPAYDGSDAYWLHRRRDVEIAQQAQAVFTLNMAMREELMARGVPEVKLHVVANGLSQPGPLSAEAAAQVPTRRAIGCTAQKLLGYIGSLSDYEGCADLLHALACLRKQGQDVALMVVGSAAPSGLIGARADQTAGPSAEAVLQDLAQRLGVAAHVHFLAQMAESKVAGYYRLCDVIVLPRHATPVTQLVPPIKPYTAASHHVPVVMSDLVPLREIAAEIGARLFAPGDIEAMAQAISAALTAPEAASGTEAAAESGAEFVAPQTLSWAQRVRPMLRLFASVTAAERQRIARLVPMGNPGEGADAGAPVRRFDTLSLPLVGLQAQLGTQVVACLGPGLDLRDSGRFVALTRQNILDVLATHEPGRFVIDWAGFQADPAGFAASEWAGLWSSDAMRLNRQVMDACRIALDRGWRLVVSGPVNRAEAPLFRTVSGVLEEQLPEAEAQAQTQTRAQTRAQADAKNTPEAKAAP